MTRTARFSLGQVAITANASLRLSTEEVFTALKRHASGDWGDLCPEDTLANDTALGHGSRLFSAYGQGDNRFWVYYRGRPVRHHRSAAGRLLIDHLGVVLPGIQASAISAWRCGRLPGRYSYQRVALAAW